MYIGISSEIIVIFIYQLIIKMWIKLVKMIKKQTKVIYNKWKYKKYSKKNKFSENNSNFALKKRNNSINFNLEKNCLDFEKFRKKEEKNKLNNNYNIYENDYEKKSFKENKNNVNISLSQNISDINNYIYIIKEIKLNNIDDGKTVPKKGNKKNISQRDLKKCKNLWIRKRFIRRRID